MHLKPLGLNEQLVQAVTDLGFETPSEIQQKAIPVLIIGHYRFYWPGTNRYR